MKLYVIDSLDDLAELFDRRADDERRTAEHNANSGHLRQAEDRHLEKRVWQQAARIVRDTQLRTGPSDTRPGELMARPAAKPRSITVDLSQFQPGDALEVTPDGAVRRVEP